MMDISKVHNVMLTVASEGAQLCLESFLDLREVYNKGGDEVVSELDFKISTMLKERLEIIGFFEDTANLLVDEETVPQPSVHEISNSKYVVIIDPVDGSGAAIEGRSEYCVMIALFEHIGDSQLKPIVTVVARPKERELITCSPESGIELTVNVGTNMQATRCGKEAVCSPFPPRNMLFDYRFGQMFTWSETPKAHLNPSGANMCDMAVHRGLGFVFVYKSWDLIPLGLCYATGIKSYLLTQNSDKSFSAERVSSLDMNWFDYDTQTNTYGKIKQPLLFCKPENLTYILDNLKAV